MELYTGNDEIIRSATVNVYQSNSNKTFNIKQPLQHLILLETTIKETANERQCSCKEAAMKVNAIHKLTT